MPDIRDKLFMEKWKEYMKGRDQSKIMFAIHPGEVRGGDIYLSATYLSRLYRIPKLKWIDWKRDSKNKNWDDYFHLYPSHVGYYDLPQEVYDAIR